MDDNPEYPLHLFDQSSPALSPTTPTYTSCIRVSGKPLLPPLLTDDLRKELQNYKTQAKTVELRVKNRRSASLLVRPSSLKLNQTLEHKLMQEQSDSDEYSGRFSPLNKASLSELKVTLPLERQRSYTVLDPSPQLLELITQKERPQRKTWDLSRKSWCVETCNESDSTEDYPIHKNNLHDQSTLIKMLEKQHEDQRKELIERQKRERALLERKQAEILALLQRKRPKSAHSHRSGASETFADRRAASVHGDCLDRDRGDYWFNKTDETDLEYSLPEDLNITEGYFIKVENGDIDSTSESSIQTTLSGVPAPNNAIVSMGITGDKYQKAATVICAAAKGYLTRRLLRTAHVQELFRSLKDTIACMRKLRNASDLAKADLELMAGLTRQTKSNWEAVYDVFITKSTAEQMQIIAADRARLIVLMTKPSPSTTTSTTPRQQLSDASLKTTWRKRVMSASMPPLGTSKQFTRDCCKMTTSLTAETSSPTATKHSMTTSQ